MSEPRWLDEPTAPSTLPHLPLQRVKPGAALLVVLTSGRMLGVPTHFMGRRTLPCVKEGCPGCEGKLATRPEWYCSALSAAPHRHVILALTPDVAWRVKEHFKHLTTLRGVGLILSRATKAPNSRLLVECRELETAQQRLPEEPDLVKHLLHIWGLDQAHLGQDEPAYVNRVKDQFKSNGNHADAV